MTDSALAENRIRLMSPVGPLSKFAPAATWLMLGVGGLACAALGRSWLRLPAVGPIAEKAAAMAHGDAAAWAAECTLTGADWTVIQRSQPVPSLTNSANDSRLRLAGTFFQINTGATNEMRRAILDDLSSGTQHIVSEGEEFGGIRVVAISGDHVVVSDPVSGERTLWLNFLRNVAGATNAAVAGSVAAQGMNRFGTRQIGTNRWVFSRDPLMKYYGELMDQPERLVRVFDSLKPRYTPQGKISGYRLDVEGEADFFDAVGLRQNDVVSSVNSLPMTSRTRAEFFIRQFVADRANAFVLEVEREGGTRKLVYEVR